LWRFGFRAQDWINAGFNSIVNNSYSTGNAFVAWATSTSYCANMAFFQGTQNQMNTSTATAYIMGINCGGLAGQFNLYNGSAGVQALIIKPTGEIDLNSKGVGIIVDSLSATGGLYATTGVSSGAGYDSTTGYKSGGNQFVNSSGQVDAAKLAATTGVAPAAALGTGTPSSTTALFGDQTYKTVLSPLTGTTAAIGGSALLAGQCSAGTATVTGATTSMAVAVSPSSDPDSNLSAGIGIYGFVSSSNTVTVRVCAIVAVTPSSVTYNVRVIQ
jgi:hypothetical protein